MRVWRWYRGLRGWIQVVIAVVGIPVVAALAYVGVRGIQYAAAEKELALYVPQSANVVVRVHDLEGHWERIRTTPAWRTLQRRLLKDPFLRRRINALLEGTPVPTLNELEDERKRGAWTEENLMLLAGRDVAAAVRVQESWARARFCGGTHLPFLAYLGTPFIGWFLPAEVHDGRTLYKVETGRRTIWIALEGALALGATDADLLVEALGRKGTSGQPERPIAARIDFEGSPALGSLRRKVKESGALQHVDFDTVKSLEFSADVQGGGLLIDALLVGGTATHPFAAPPHEFTRFAPATGSGLLVENVGARDIYAWMEFVAQGSTWPGLSKNMGIALNTLNEHGFKEKFLPHVDHGMAVLFGSEPDEGEGREFPGVALVFSSSNPTAARDGLHEAVVGIAGSQADTRLQRELVENTELYFWRMPGAFRINEFLQPSYAATENAVIFANNSSFLRSIVTAAARGEGFQGMGPYRAASRALRDYGYSETPAFVRGLFVLPLLRQSLDGLFPRIAELIVDGSTDPRDLRRQIEKEMRELGLPLSDDAEINRRYQAALARRYEEAEANLRRSFAFLDRMRWVALESSSAPKGMTLRVAVQLTNRTR